MSFSNKSNNNFLYDNEMNLSNNSTNLLIKNNSDLFHNQLLNFGTKKKKVNFSFSNSLSKTFSNKLNVVNDQINKSNNNIIGILKKRTTIKDEDKFSSTILEKSNINYDQIEIQRWSKKREIKYRHLMKKNKINFSDEESSDEENIIKVKWIILPNNKYKILWDYIINFIIFYSIIVTPYQIAFTENNYYSKDGNKINIIDLLMDIFLFIDIILNFFTAFIDKFDKLIIDRKKIVFNYLFSWFIIDFISILPLNYMTKKNFNYNRLTRLTKIPKLYKIIRFLKLLRITKINSKQEKHLTKSIFHKLQINDKIIKLLVYSLTFFLITHIMSCLWYFITSFEENSNNWVIKLGYLDKSNFEKYIICVYWTLTTMTTVGYGDITAISSNEKIYNILNMGFGVVIYSFAIGSMSTIVQDLNEKNKDVQKKLNMLEHIKKQFKIDNKVYYKVKRIIKFELNKEQNEIKEFLDELPHNLKVELSKVLHDNKIKNLYIFLNKPSDFIAYVAPLLKPIIFLQDDYIYKVNDIVKEIFFVCKGTVIFCLDLKYGEKEIKKIKKNNNFGEIEMCLNERLIYNIKIKSRKSDLFILKNEDFLKISVNYSSYIEEFLYNSLVRYLNFNELMQKEIRRFEKIWNTNLKTYDRTEEQNKIFKQLTKNTNLKFSTTLKMNDTLLNENNKTKQIKKDWLDLPSNPAIEEESSSSSNFSNYEENMKNQNKDIKTNTEIKNENVRKISNKKSFKHAASIQSTATNFEEDMINNTNKIIDFLIRNNVNLDDLPEDPRILLNHFKICKNFKIKLEISKKIESILENLLKLKNISLP